ncbi:MAG: NAD(P)H-hydrate dehydratase [Nitrospira sp.]|nr:NAD(P)H-hydrate dehydratase [Nitrospira sp.]
MMLIVTAAQMQALDRRTIEEAGVPGTTLMERAGAGVVASLEHQLGALRGKVITIFCGKGNNGGDGFVVARLLHKQRAKVQVFTLAPATDLSGDAARMYRQLVRTAGKTVVKPFTSTGQIQTILGDSHAIIDALLGTGLAAPVTGRYAEAIDIINQAERLTVAVDLPSGIHADTGAVLGRAVKADLTVTFGLPKLGLFLNQGIDHAGRVEIVDIGIPPAYVDATESRIRLITAPFVQTALPPRRLSSHKGTFGHAGIIAGSVGKTGAAAMSAQAALRMGAGLVTVAIPASVNDVLEAKLLEVMTIPMPETKARTLSRAALDRLKDFIAARTAVAIGPGLSTHPETIELVQALVRQLDRPSVLDADALNALAGRAALFTECTIPPILTPHPGEMARLVTESSAQSVNGDRIGTAARFARERGCYLVLKGARTVIAGPDGRVAICPTGNPGMATAGTGDVLTGMIVGLLAQGVASWEAACAATYVHGLAGDLAAETIGQTSLIARDVIDHIPYALTNIGSA